MLNAEPKGGYNLVSCTMHPDDGRYGLLLKAENGEYFLRLADELCRMP
jgi:hypothetical protein